MALAERLSMGVNLTIMGMGLVFLLLVLLWGLLVLILRLDREPTRTESPGSPGPARQRAGRPLEMAPELFSAIAVAVLTHQAILRKQAAPSMRSHWPGSILFASRWVAAGRHQQTQNWHPGKR
jgi:Na+-transporting methylmalonyl-CoA/oxaloacetate decarboxylase gamma subunit